MLTGMKLSETNPRAGFSLLEVFLALALFGVVLAMVAGMLAAEVRLCHAGEEARLATRLREEARLALAKEEKGTVAMKARGTAPVLIFPGADWLPEEAGASVLTWEWVTEEAPGGTQWRIFREKQGGRTRSSFGVYESFPE